MALSLKSQDPCQGRSYDPHEDPAGQEGVGSLPRNGAWMRTNISLDNEFLARIHRAPIHFRPGMIWSWRIQTGTGRLRENSLVTPLGPVSAGEAGQTIVELVRVRGIVLSWPQGLWP